MEPIQWRMNEPVKLIISFIIFNNNPFLMSMLINRHVVGATQVTAE